MAVAINLTNNLQSLKSNIEIEGLKAENKSDFKDYLSKEVNLKNQDSSEKTSKVIKDNTSSNVNEISSDEDKLTTEELSSKISEKIEEILNNEDLKSNLDTDDLEEILALLINLIEVNLKDFTPNNDTNINEVNFSNIESNNNILSLIGKEDESFITNFNEDISLDKGKEVLNNIDSLIEDYLANFNETEVLNSNKPINEIQAELLDEVRNLINMIPDSSIKEVEDNLKTDIGKEILNALVLNDNIGLKSNNANKDNILKDAINKDTVINIEDSSKSSESKVSLEDIHEENLNKGETSKKDNINTEEEKILMKFLDDDNSQSFAKTLNYYDKLNKINSNAGVIKEPIVVNKETINLDIIKNIKYMVRNAVEELKVKIYPKELGEMTIKILSEEGIMKAEIKATSKETYNLLNSNLNEIKKTLEDQNIRIQEVNIGIYNEDTTFFNGKESSRDNLNEFNNKREGSLIYEEDEILEDLLIDNNVNFLA